MAPAPAVAQSPQIKVPATGITTSYVTFTVADQLFGISVMQVQDILVPGRIAPVPLAPPEVRGAINLRGRIVTVIDMHRRLGLPPRASASADASGETMGVTVECGRELYTLLVDRVGDVVDLPMHLREPNPSTLDRLWLDFADGVFALQDRLMVVLDAERLLQIRRQGGAG